jgi:hypothetical protein
MSEGRLAAIFGNGRSGTTWLGSIVSSHPEVAYRFEPFKRARKLGPALAETGRMLDTAELDSLTPERIYNALLPAYPDWEKPPFFSKDYRTRMKSGRALLWPPAKASSLVGKLYRSLYTPQEKAFVVFKEVAFEDAFQKLVKTSEMPLVYLLRHPCAVVSSILRGQEQGLMGSRRQQVLPAFLQDHAPALWDRYGEGIDLLSPHQKEALLWRTAVERCQKAFGLRDSASVVFYENLCRDPLGVSTEVLHGFGLDLTPQVRDFIGASSDPNFASRGRRSEVGTNKYFSVFRDPLVAMDSWKEALSAEQRLEVLEIVRDSPVFERGIQEAQWDH